MCREPLVCTSNLQPFMMRPRTLLATFLACTVALLGSGAGCSTLTGTEEERAVEHLVAEVDSLDVPAQIASSDTLSIRLSGTVGPNGCYSFDRFDTERSTDRLTVTPVVEHVTGEGFACTMAIVPLDATFAAAPPFEEGVITIAVPQSDRPDVTATVQVTSGE